ncbi:MAG: Ig-like domain-containing protein [Terriglobales bacterium]
MTLSPATAAIDVGKTQQFTMTATTNNGQQQTGVSASWTSSNASVATVSQAGLATAVAAGTTTITATVQTSAGPVSGSATLTVNAPSLVSIAVTPANPSIATGQTQQFTATGTYSDGSHQVISSPTWTSTDASVATIDSSGLATGVGAGTTTIAASSGGVNGSTVLTVNARILVSIAVTPANPSIAVGQTQQFTATGTYSDGGHQVIASPNWSSTDASVATIDSSGLATGMGVGTTSIGASSGGVNGSTTLTVTGSHTYLGTQSPGDLWTVSIDDVALTFSAANTSASLNYAGTLTALPNGFYKTTLTASTDPGLPI